MQIPFTFIFPLAQHGARPCAAARATARATARDAVRSAACTVGAPLARRVHGGRARERRLRQHAAALEPGRRLLVVRRHVDVDLDDLVQRRLLYVRQHDRDLFGLLLVRQKHAFRPLPVVHGLMHSYPHADRAARHVHRVCPRHGQRGCGPGQQLPGLPRRSVARPQYGPRCPDVV